MITMKHKLGVNYTPVHAAIYTNFKVQAHVLIIFNTKLILTVSQCNINEMNDLL